MKTPTFIIPYASASYLASYFNIKIAVNSIENNRSNNNSKNIVKIYNSSGIGKITTTKTTSFDAAKENSGVSTEMYIHNGSPIGTVNSYYSTKAQISFDEVSLEGAYYPRNVTVTSNTFAYSLKSVKQ